MTLDISWQAVSVLAGLALGWTGFLVGIIKWLLGRAIGNVEERLKHTAEAASQAAAVIQKHREDCLAFRGQLPIHYHRREDMIRFETLTHAKLDALASDIRQLECKKCSHNPL